MKNLLATIVLVLLFVGLLFYGNYQFVAAQPGGTDFLYRWLPTRLVLLYGYENPYSPEVEYQVELMHHGHAHEEDETPGIFAYPYYTMMVFAPFAFIGDFLVARSVWMTIMELAHLGIVLLTLQIINFRPSKFLGFAFILFALFPADFAQALVDGNPSSLAAFFAVLSLFFIYRQQDIVAGIFLALSTIKPQLVVLFLPVVVIWALTNKRMKIVYASGICLISLAGISFLFQPNWLVEFYTDLTTYVDVARPSTPLAIMSYWMPVSIARSISVALSVASFGILFGVVKYCWGRDFSTLFWAGSLLFVLMPLTGITSAKSNYVAMLPAAILLVSVFHRHINVKDTWLGFALFSWVLLSWLFFYAGRNWVVNGTLIYFVDFYPLPLILLMLMFALKPLKNPDRFVLQ